MTLHLFLAGLGILIHAGVFPPTGSQAADVGGESARALAAGRTLYQERGCVNCHEPDRCGVGPSLDGLFGKAVKDRTRGVAIVDESYLREAILNPAATVAEGFPPGMPDVRGSADRTRTAGAHRLPEVVERACSSTAPAGDAARPDVERVVPSERLV